MILQRCLTRTFYHVRQKVTHLSTTSSNLFIRRHLITNNDHISLTSNKQLRNILEDSDENRLLKLIKLECYQLRDDGKRAPNPESVTESNWKYLLTLKTMSARKKHYAHLYRSENNKEKSLMKKLAKKQDYLEYKESKTLEERQNYQPISKTSFFLRIRKDTMNKWRNHKLAQAMVFGEKLIFDCSYDQHMNSREAKSAAKQLELSFSVNRLHKQPFDIHFCNANFNYDTMKHLERRIPTMRNVEYPMNVHEGSYLDLFPKEKLVYLTPHCKEDLIEYDPDTIYIIGAMVNRGNDIPLSLGKAKELGLRIARLPLNRYLKWSSGNKSLTLDQMTKIMLDFRVTRNWEYAFRHVPKRKVVDCINNRRCCVANGQQIAT